MKRLLFDLTPLDTPSGPRGIGRYIRELARGLSELSSGELHGIEIVGLTSFGFAGDFRLSDDLASYQGEIRSPTEKDFYRWAYRQRLSFFLAAKRAGAHAVHLGDPHATPLFMGLSGAKKIVTCHDLVPTRYPDRYFGPKDGGEFVGKRIERRRYASADHVVAISEATKGDVVSLLGVSPERVTRVYNSVDTETWRLAAQADGRATLARTGLSDRSFALYVGGSDWRKNVEGMMAGLAHVRRAGADMRLAWAGHLQPGHVEGVLGAAQKAGVSDAVTLLGYVSDDDLAVLYRAARAHLFVSRCEGFGLTVIEAMAAGCPVITTSGGSLGEVAGDAALKVDPEDATAIGDALMQLDRDGNLRERLIDAGRARASASEFSRAFQARAMVNVYRAVLGE